MHNMSMYTWTHLAHHATTINEIKILIIPLRAEASPVATPGLRNETLPEVTCPRPLCLSFVLRVV